MHRIKDLVFITLICLTIRCCCEQTWRLDLLLSEELQVTGLLIFFCLKQFISYRELVKITLLLLLLS